jgi:chitodextrinase
MLNGSKPIRICRAPKLLLAALCTSALSLGAIGVATNAQAQPTIQHIGVPAYFNPNGSGGAYWTQLDQSAPEVGIAIANPNNGPGSAFDQGYANAIQAATNAGVHVIGYVDTGYFGTTGRTTRTGQTTTSAWTSQIEGDVQNWYSWYGSYGVAGIFFDDGLNDCGTNNAHVNLYIAINTYTKQQHSGAITVDNPGTAAAQCYSDAADTLVMFEGTYASYTGWTAPSWELNSSNPDQFWHLVYSTPTQADMENAAALSKQRNAGYLYVTNDALPNPWDTLPTGTYWSDELAQTNASGGGDTSAPSAPSGLHATNVGSTSVTLSWNASSDNVGVAAYDVYAASTVVATASGGSTSTTVGNLTPGATYTFTVKARDAAGNTSPASAPLSVTTSSGSGGGSCAPVTGSGAITNFSACMDATSDRFSATFDTAVSLHHVFINTDNNTATGFQLPSPSSTPLGADYMIENNTLYRSLSSGWSWTAVSGVSPNMTVNGNTYSWTVPLSAFTNPATTQQAEFNGNTFYTTPITFTQGGGGGTGGGDTTAPSAPTSLHTTSVGSTSATLAWTASTDNVGVTAYDVYSGSTLETTVSGTSATVDNLNPSTAYTFTVKARDAAGNTSPASSPLSVTTTTSGGGGNCTPVAGSGDITDFSACASSGSVSFEATFNTSTSFHHVFINTDNNTATGFQLPSPSSTPLGADYMIENNTLYRSLSSGWSWTAVGGVSPNMTVNGNTYSWTVPLSAFTNPATTQQAEFNANQFYTTPVTYSAS